jgi:hypothetical protein
LCAPLRNTAAVSVAVNRSGRLAYSGTPMGRLAILSSNRRNEEWIARCGRQRRVKLRRLVETANTAMLLFPQSLAEASAHELSGLLLPSMKPLRIVLPARFSDETE